MRHILEHSSWIHKVHLSLGNQPLFLGCPFDSITETCAGGLHDDDMLEREEDGDI
jgi:hypothetical protein